MPEKFGLINKYFLYPTANMFVPFVYKIGLTPNMVTTITLILRLIVIYLLYYKKNYFLIIILFVISSITDGIDGELARTYDMKSYFGAIYDVSVDVITILLIVLVLFKIYYVKNRNPLFIMLLFVPILFIIQILKTNCFNTTLKVWEINLIKKIKIINVKYCNYLTVIKKYDEGFNYLFITLCLIYTLYFHTDKYNKKK